MTQRAEIARTINIKYVHAESSRSLLHRRRDTKKIKHTGTQEKNNKGKKRKTKSRKHDDGRKCSNLVSVKMKACLLYHPGSELRLLIGEREKRREKINLGVNWMGKKKKRAVYIKCY